MSKFRAVASFVFVSAVFASVFFLYLPLLADNFISTGGINSDLVEPFLIIQDFLSNPYTLITWHQTTTLFLVPDWILAAIVVQAPLPNVWLPLLYEVAHLILLACAIAAVVRVVTKHPFVLVLATTVAVGSAFALMARGVPDARIGPVFILSMGGPYDHAGAGLMTMVAAACYLSALKRSFPSRARRLIWLLAGVTLIASASDPIFIVWFAVPALVALWLAPPNITRADKWLISALMIGAAVAGWLVSALALGVRYGGYTTVLDAAVQAAGMAVKAFATRDLAFGAILVPIVVIAVRAVMTLIESCLGTRHTTIARFFELLMAGSAAGTILGPILAAVVVDASSLRYFKFLFPIAITVTTYGFLRSRIGLHQRAIGVGSSAFLIALLAVAPGAGWHAARTFAQRGPLVTCLAARGAAAGFGDYWTAKETIFRSDRRIHVVQITPDGDPYRWSFNERWFWRHANHGKRLKPRFVVVDRLGAANVRDLFGQPDRKTKCGRHNIWYYDRTLDLPYAGRDPGRGN